MLNKNYLIFSIIGALLIFIFRIIGIFKTEQKLFSFYSIDLIFLLIYIIICLSLLKRNNKIA